MKIIFVSNYFNHHQKFFCEALFNKFKSDFRFISTIPMRTERRQLGYLDEHPDYVICAYTDRENYKKALKLIAEADIVIAGSASENYLLKRILKNKIVFRYSEHPFKKEEGFWKWIRTCISYHLKNPKSKQIYMLCASAYAAKEFHEIGLFKGKTYKWGYFPETIKYREIEEVIKTKKRIILWCGRFLKWKNPAYAIEIANKLRNNGYNFEMILIGQGEEEEYLKNKVEEYRLEKVVRFLGAMSPQKVRRHMEEASIFLFTSNHQEGWGAVLNEAMNSGCAVVANSEIGSVPFLIKHNKNGLVYQNGDIEMLFNNVKILLDNSLLREKLGKEAYFTIVNEWNAEEATNRLVSLIENIMKNRKDILHEDGPCSYAAD